MEVRARLEEARIDNGNAYQWKGNTNWVEQYNTNKIVNHMHSVKFPNDFSSKLLSNLNNCANLFFKIPS